ncbi:MAG: cytoskeletal protein CcmA (bactofilin family) [Verrucomicrobiales bacterium]
MVNTNVTLSGRGGLDLDFDGLPDFGERVIGTKTDDPDSDADGIRDDAEITQGLNPLDGLAFPTGIIASLPLPGQANEIVVVGSPVEATRQTSYLATGTHGLAIVDSSAFNNPILLGQLDLPGDATDVAFDVRRNRVIVTSGTGGTHIVDVANGMRPVLLATNPNQATQVEILDGVAYLVEADTIQSLDLTLLTPFRSLQLHGTITGLTKEGSTLYAMTADNLLQVISISGNTMNLRGSITLPHGGGDIFVGNGIAYLSANDNPAGGMLTADVSDADNPILISDADAPTGINEPTRSIVVNGSGLAIIAGTSGNTSQLRVLDVSDPANTDVEIIDFNLAAPPLNRSNSVAVAGGVAFIAADTGGLTVLNYRVFDSNRIAPDVTLAATVIDQDTATTGIQVMEGSTIPLIASVKDDVQVRNVELLRNGVVIRNDVSFPFEFSPVAPGITMSSSTASFVVRAYDTGGNVSDSAALNLELTPDSQGPSIIFMDPSDGGTRGEGINRIRIRFDEPIAESSVVPAAFALSESGGVNPVEIELEQLEFGRTVQLTFAGLSGGDYELALDGTLITDRAGNPLDTGDMVSAFFVAEATAVFNNDVGGDWDVPGNWDAGTLPLPTDHVLIDVPSGSLVTIDSNVEVRSLRGNSDVAVTNNAVVDIGTIQLDAELRVLDGTILDGEILPGLQNHPAIIGVDAVFNNVTAEADIDLTLVNGKLTLLNGFTLNGTLHMARPSILLVLSSMTIEGAGTILVGATGTSGTSSIVVSGSRILTIGDTLTIRGGGGRFSNSTNNLTPTVVNRGTIISDVNNQTIDTFGNTIRLINEGTIKGVLGGDLRIVSSGNWVNKGLIKLSGGGQLDLVNGVSVNQGRIDIQDSTLFWFGANQSNAGEVNLVNSTFTLQNTGTGSTRWTNFGTFNSTNSVMNFGFGGWINGAGGQINQNGGTFQPNGIWESPGQIDLSNAVVKLAGTFNYSDVINIHHTSNTITLEGTLIASGESIDLDAVFDGDLNFNGGRLVGGTVTSTSGLSKLVFNNNTSNRMDVVTVNVDIDMTASDAQLDLATGLTLNGTLFLTTLGNSDITTLNSVLIDGTGTIFADRTASTNGTASFVVNNGHTLTFGADLTVRGSNLNISRASSTAHVVNEGTFEADVAGGAINFSGLTSFINNSDLIATNGGDFTFNSSWTNNGNISLADAGILTINGVGTNSASGQITLTNAVWTQNQTVTNAGTFTIDGTNLNKGIRTFTQTGTLIARNGSSVTGAFTNDGLLEVDGTLTINGNFTQTISGSLDIDIDGSAPSTDYDVLAITGSASLSGTLNLTTGFTALLNDTFDILTYTSLSGTFDTVNGIDLGAGLQYDLDYGVGDLTLTVVNV